MYNSRQHSPQNALYGTSLSSASHHAMVLQNFNMPSLEPYQTRGSPSVASHDTFDCDFDFNFDTPQAVREHCNHTVTDAGQFRSDLVMAEAPVTAPLRSEETDFWGDVIPSTEMQVEHSGISRILQDDEHLSTTQVSRATSSHISTIDWRRYLSFFPSRRSSSGASVMAPRSPRYPSRPLSTIRGGTKSSARAFFHDNIALASHKRQGSQLVTSQQTGGRVTFLSFDGKDPERIMLPLQLLRSNYI